MNEILTHPSRIKVPYTWSAGEALSRFFKALRDEQKILGSRCLKCRKVYVPPKKTCGTCFVECSEWLEVGPSGTLVSFSQASYPSPAHRVLKPLFGLIRLEGADTSFLHMLGETNLQSLKIGVKVLPVFAEKRTGSILDIAYFKVIS